METGTFIAPDISCGHCVNAILEELSLMDGVQDVQADKDSKQVTVVYDAPATEASIRDLLEDIGYPAAS